MGAKQSNEIAQPSNLNTQFKMEKAKSEILNPKIKIQKAKNKIQFEIQTAQFNSSSFWRDHVSSMIKYLNRVRSALLDVLLSKVAHPDSAKISKSSFFAVKYLQ